VPKVSFFKSECSSKQPNFYSLHSTFRDFYSVAF